MALYLEYIKESNYRRGFKMGIMVLILIVTNVGTFLVTYYGMKKVLFDMGMLPVFKAFIRGHCRKISVEAEVRDSYRRQFDSDVRKYCGHLNKGDY